jgi:hypothetical protein
VICALNYGICQSYWTNTGSAAEIISLMEKKFRVITDDIIRLIAGIPVDIHLENYSAEKLSLKTKEKKYALALKDYTEEKLAGGISWYKKTKAHKILIEDID